MNKHTKGTWTKTTDGDANFHGVALIGVKNKWLMRIQQNGELSVGEQEANMNLITAAPDLLEALIGIRSWVINKGIDVEGKLFKNIESALKKATEL